MYFNTELGSVDEVHSAACVANFVGFGGSRIRDSMLGFVSSNRKAKKENKEEDEKRRMRSKKSRELK